jgi:hypothetical protein
VVVREGLERAAHGGPEAPELKEMAAVALGVSACARQRQGERNEKSWN